MMSCEIRQGYDVKLVGRTSRYRLIEFVGEDEAIVHQHHPRTMKPQRRQIKVRVSEFEALCTGLAWDGSGPLWQKITGWITYPKMPGPRYALLAEGDPTEQAAANIQHDMEA